MKEDDKDTEVVVPVRRVYQIIVKFEAAQTIEALIVADTEDEAVQAVRQRLVEEHAPEHEYEVEEMTPDFIETMFLAATDPASPFAQIGVNVDLSDIPAQVLDVLLPQCKGGDEIRAFIEAGAKTPNIRLVH